MILGNLFIAFLRQGHGVRERRYGGGAVVSDVALKMPAYGASDSRIASISSGSSPFSLSISRRRNRIKGIIACQFH